MQGGGVKTAASTSVTVTGVTTTVADTLIVQAASRDTDSAAAAFSAQTNANLTGITDGNGGTETITVTATSGNTTLIPNANIAVNYTSPNSTGTLVFTPAGFGAPFASELRLDLGRRVAIATSAGRGLQTTRRITWTVPAGSVLRLLARHDPPLVFPMR